MPVEELCIWNDTLGMPGKVGSKGIETAVCHGWPGMPVMPMLLLKDLVLADLEDRVECFGCGTVVLSMLW